MSGLGDALQNIGRDWSARISSREQDEKDEKRYLLLERLRQNNAMELARFQQMLAQEDEELKRNSPEYKAAQARDEESYQTDKAYKESRTLYNNSRSAQPANPPKNVGGYIYEWDEKLGKYVDTGRKAVQRQYGSRKKEENTMDPFARLRSGLGL